MDFEIQNSKIHKQGLFTHKYFPKNQPLFKFTGNLISEEEIDKLPKDKQANYLQVNKSLYLDVSGTPFFFCNHSCNPNCSIQIIMNNPFLVALRDINIGDELFFDYSTTSTDSLEDWKMDCNCKEWNCRKIISGYQYLNDKTKQYYTNLNAVPKYLL